MTPPPAISAPGDSRDRQVDCGSQLSLLVDVFSQSISICPGRSPNHPRARRQSIHHVHLRIVISYQLLLRHPPIVPAMDDGLESSIACPSIVEPSPVDPNIPCVVFELEYRYESRGQASETSGSYGVNSRVGTTIEWARPSP